MRTFKPRLYSLKTILVIFDSQEDASENNCSFNNTNRKLKDLTPWRKSYLPLEQVFKF